MVKRLNSHYESLGKFLLSLTSYVVVRAAIYVTISHQSCRPSEKLLTDRVVIIIT